MAKLDRIAGCFIVITALYYCWNAYAVPVRGDEAYLYLKSVGLSWNSLAPTGLIEFVIKGMDFFGSSSLQLRLPSILFISFSSFIIYQVTLKIADIYVAWFNVVLFSIFPAITYSYISMTPNAMFIFCVALYVYFFYKIAVEKDRRPQHHILLTLSIIMAISIDFSGILLLLNNIIYSLIKKEVFDDRYYILIIIISFIALIIFITFDYINMFDLFYKYPVNPTNKAIFKIIFFIILYLPIFFVVFSFFKNREFDDKLLPFVIMNIIFATGCIIFSLIYNYDIRFIGAWIIPAIILSGYIYGVYGYRKYAYKVAIVVIAFILMLTSVYTNVYNKSSLTPSYMSSTRIFETSKMSMQIIIDYGDSIFSHTPELASIISYNTLLLPEACTLEVCENSSGVFISDKKEEELDKYFQNVQDANIYKLISAKEGIMQFYIYKVYNLKSKINAKKSISIPQVLPN